jgi:hypothetical protein
VGFTQPDYPDVDPDEFSTKPLLQRIHILNRDWLNNGYGFPKMIHCIYIARLVLFFTLGGVVIATATSPGVPAFWHVPDWWNQPIVYQKLIVWIVLLECLNLAGAWGPLCGKYKPMTGGFRFWARRGTIRERPWYWIPGTGGDRRTWFDVGVYLALLASLAVALVMPGVASDSLSARLPDNTSGLISPALVAVPVVLLVLIGLRDKIVFLAARSEQYLPALIFFTVLPFTDMIIAAKILIVLVWIGAGFSKFGSHFANVISPMVSNSPITPKWLRRTNYRDFPRDVRPSRFANFMAHVNGTAVEIATPLVLLFSVNKWLTLGAALLMVCFHLFIISMFPLAVPLEWNVVFAYVTVFLFLGFPAWDGYNITDMSSPWLTVAIVAALLVFPVLGELRPDKVSFLAAFRQYSANWATSVWAFAPGAEAKLNRITRPTTNQIDQLVASGYERKWADVMLQRVIAWRSMHSQGRGLLSVLISRLPDVDTRTVREGEVLCNSIVGFNFGDGHLHNEDMIRAVQHQVGFEPGEVIIVWAESSAFGSDIQRYKVIDAARGVIERGTWKVSEAVAEQPWLPNGPIPLQVTWSARKPAAHDERSRGHQAPA